MVAALLSSLCLTVAPVPEHLFPPPKPDPIRVGFKWWFEVYGGAAYQCQVVKVEGERVYYRCLTHPGHTWQQSPCGTPGLSFQSKEQTRKEVAACYQYPEPGLPDWLYR